ncbi:MAG: hypothetical protein LM580_07960 [Thermofilum sp.]|nr:hypothetical protein [Thermofilum sp.]
MPFVRKIADRLEKYSIKYPDATTQTARLTAVKSIMDLRYQAASSPIVNVVDIVRGILEGEGVPSGLHGMYYAFGQALAKLQFSHTGATLNKEVAGLKNMWVTAYKADAAILDKIITAILGAVPPY